MTAWRAIVRFWRDRSGSAAAEMGFASPLLLILMFGAFELGNYFLDQHVVSQAVRDGARYAARQSFASYSGCAVDPGVVTSTRNVTRTAQVASGGPLRIYYWTDENTVSVTVACDTTGNYTGIYRGLTEGAPVVTVAATVPYIPLLAPLGFDSLNLSLNAQSSSAVTGL